MKNTKHTPTRSKLTQPNACARRDTKSMHKFEVELYWTQYNRASVIIEAASLAEAEEKADNISSEDVENWNPFDGELYVESVEPLTGGKDDE